MALPETTMTEEMVDWPATMDDPWATRTTRRSSRKRETTPDQIITVEGLDAALEPALAEIRAIAQPKADDVLPSAVIVSEIIDIIAACARAGCNASFASMATASDTSRLVFSNLPCSSWSIV